MSEDEFPKGDVCLSTLITAAAHARRRDPRNPNLGPPYAPLSGWEEHRFIARFRSLDMVSAVFTERGQTAAQMYWDTAPGAQEELLVGKPIGWRVPDCDPRLRSAVPGFPEDVMVYNHWTFTGTVHIDCDALLETYNRNERLESENRRLEGQMERLQKRARRLEKSTRRLGRRAWIAERNLKRAGVVPD